MWLEYIKERMPNKSVINRDGMGFAVYYVYEAEQAIYLEDIFIAKEHRMTGIGKCILDEVEEKVREMGFRYVLGSIDPTAENTDISLKSMLNTGFKPYKIDNGLLFLRKDIYGR
jgi:GNAT superfamily N-acetyltransferase